MPLNIVVREYRPEDAQALANIYYNTIHTINTQHYTNTQVDAWAPATSLNGERWAQKFARTKPFVAVLGDEIVGFAEFEPNGHIDCFYCHHAWIGRGVGRALMNKILTTAHQLHIFPIFAEVSITAKPFFERQGFTVICEQTVTMNGIALINYKMEKLV